MTSARSASCGSVNGVEPVGRTGSSRAVDKAVGDRIARLSSGQLEVLRLVNRHLSSKEIAARLGISSHTVDQRVRGAIRALGVTRRSEAARLLHQYDEALGLRSEEPEATPEYQQLIYQAPDIDAEPDRGQPRGAVSSQIRHADRTGGVGAERLETEQRVLSARPLLLPWSTPHQASNAWSVGERLVAVAGIAIMSSLSVGMMLAGLESLSRLLQS